MSKPKDTSRMIGPPGLEIPVKTFRIIERVVYEVEAGSAQSALEIFLEDGANKHFIEVTERYVMDEKGTVQDVEDPPK